MRHCPFARCVSGMQRHSQSKESPKSDQSVNDKSHSVGDPRVAKEEIEREYLYVLGTLLSQGLSQATNYVRSHSNLKSHRNPFQIETFVFPNGRWRLDASRFLLCPDLQFYSDHLHNYSSQSSSNEHSPRYHRRSQHQCIH